MKEMTNGESACNFRHEMRKVRFDTRVRVHQYEPVSNLTEATGTCNTLFERK